HVERKWIAMPKNLFGLATYAWKTIRLPVEALPGGVEAVDDPVELGAAVGVGRPELLDRVELGDPGQTVLRGLGHLHLAGQEAPVAVTRVDPEPFRCLLGEEPWLLVRGHAAGQGARGGGRGQRARRELDRPCRRGTRRSRRGTSWTAGAGSCRPRSPRTLPAAPGARARRTPRASAPPVVARVMKPGCSCPVTN